MKYPCQTVILHTQKSLTPVWLFRLLNLLSAICFTKLNKLSLSISPPPHFSWKYIKSIFPGGLTQETGSALYRIAPWDRFKNCYLFQIFAGDWVRLIRSQNSPTVQFHETWTQSLTSRNLKTGDIIREIREVKHHVYVKRQTRIRTTWLSFPFACRVLFIISTHKLVVSRKFLSIITFWAVFICSFSILRNSQLRQTWDSSRDNFSS